VESGLVANLPRPGRERYRLECGRPLESLQSTHPPLLRETEATARALRLQLQVVEVRDSTELDSAFSKMTRDRAGALVVMRDFV